MKNFCVRRLAAAAVIGITLLAATDSARASTLILDWAYRCNEDTVQVYLAAGGTGWEYNDQNFGFLRLTNQTAGTQHDYAFPTYRTGWLTKETFESLEGVVRANLESNDEIIVRWIELTLPKEPVDGTPGIPAGDTYTFFAYSTPSSNFIRTQRGWETVIECETEDVTPPVVVCTTEVESIWPPNGGFVDVGLECLVVDNVDEAPLVDVTVYCDEWALAFVAEDAVYVRARRRPWKDGRVYLIVVTATDAAGNVGTDCVAVTVPHDQSQASLDDVAEQASYAVDYFREFGEVPEDFKRIAPW